VEEEEDFRRIGIPLGQSKDVEVAVSNIEVLQNQHLLEVPVKHGQGAGRSRGRGGERSGHASLATRERESETYINPFM